MGGYLLEMADLLIAMKKTLMASTAVPYLSDVRIRNGLWDPEPGSDYTVYLMPLGSPETVVADETENNRDAKFSLHVVIVDVVKLVEDPYGEDAVVGRTGASVGITQFASDVADCLENNTLGLSPTVLESGRPPTIEFGDNAFGVVELNEVAWLFAARGTYRAQSRPFYRTGV